LIRKIWPRTSSLKKLQARIEDPREREAGPREEALEVNKDSEEAEGEATIEEAEANLEDKSTFIPPLRIEICA
jgi:hypothetical protein